jgi:outer membrane protein assembly factor BamE (lipoprotein component of BamABCDE complex)
MRHTLVLNFVAVACLVILSGCQTPRYKEFGGVKPGMEKDLVIEQAGGPNVSRRWHGKDRWIYNYVQTPNGPQTREVHFEDGKAIYVGDKVIPAVSGEEQDRINDQSNAEVEKQMTAEHKVWAEEHGVAYKPKTGDQLDADDVRLQQSLYGTRDIKRERTKIAPTYHDIN